MKAPQYNRVGLEKAKGRQEKSMKSTRFRLLVFMTVVATGLLLWRTLTSPTVLINNSAPFTVAVRLETDTGESYSVGAVSAGAQARLSISGRDKLLWAVAKYPDGQSKESQKIYTTSQGTVSVLVTTASVTIRYKL
jgi:hypothetical protein